MQTSYIITAESNKKKPLLGGLLLPSFSDILEAYRGKRGVDELAQVLKQHQWDSNLGPFNRKTYAVTHMTTAPPFK